MIRLLGWSEKVQISKHSPVDYLTKQTNAFNNKDLIGYSTESLCLYNKKYVTFFNNHLNFCVSGYTHVTTFKEKTEMMSHVRAHKTA